MGTIYEAQDALGIYLSGGEGDAGLYTDAASLGGARLAQEAIALDWDFYEADTISPLIILRVAGQNGAGDGKIRVDADGNLRYTAPGGTEGAAVTVAANTAATLIDGTTASKYVRVYREGTNPLGGAMYLRGMKIFNNVFGMENVVIGDTDARYRALFLRNRSAAGTITNIKIWSAELGTSQLSDGGALGASGAGSITTTGSFATWPAQGWVYIETSGGSRREIAWYSSRTATVLNVTSRGLMGTTAAAGATNDRVRAIPGVQYAFEALDANGRIEEEADSTTAPSAAFAFGVTEATCITLSSLAAQAEYGLRLKREAIGDAAAAWGMESRIIVKFTISGNTYSETWAGLWCIEDAIKFRAFVGQDALPDFTAAAAVESASPLTVPLAAPPSGTRRYLVGVRAVSEFGVEGVDQGVREFVLDSTGALVTPEISDARNVVLADVAGGVARLTAIYYPDMDADPATKWRIYWTTDGTDPDPGTDTPVEITMRRAAWQPAAMLLDYSFAALAYGTDLRVILRPYRSGDDTEATDETVTQLTVATALPYAPRLRSASLAAAQAIGQGVAALDDSAIVAGTSSAAFLRHLAGESQFWAQGLNVWRCLYDSLDTAGNTLIVPSGWDVVSDTVAGAGAATWYEVVSWTGGDKRIAICVGGQRVAMVDISNTTITWAGRVAGATLSSHPNPPDGIWQHPDGSGVTFHVLDSTTGLWKAFLKIDSSGYANIGVANFVRDRA